MEGAMLALKFALIIIAYASNNTGGPNRTNQAVAMDTSLRFADGDMCAAAARLLKADSHVDSATCVQIEK